MSVATETDLRAIAERGAARARAGRDRASRCSPGRPRRSATKLIVASNMQDAVLVDLAAKARPGVDVLFLETGYHFAETIGTRDAVEHVYDVRIVNAPPRADRRRAGLAAGQGPVRPRPQPVLRAAQGRAAAEHPGRLRRLGHRRAPGRGPDPGEHAAGHLRREVRAGQGQPARGLERRGHGAPTSPSTTSWSTRWSPRATRASAAPRARPKPAAGRRPAQRPLGRHRQDRMRAARLMTAPGARTRSTRWSPSRSTSSARSRASSTGR